LPITSLTRLQGTNKHSTVRMQLYLTVVADTIFPSPVCAASSFTVSTPYEAGRFRVKLVLSNDYPNSPPRAFFLTPVYHPNVGPSMDICVNTLKKDWTPSVTMSHIFQVCVYLSKKLFASRLTVKCNAITHHRTGLPCSPTSYYVAR
jgi:ubiquitin-protein ligase